jgi:hypothetical protein
LQQTLSSRRKPFQQTLKNNTHDRLKEWQDYLQTQNAAGYYNQMQPEVIIKDVGNTQQQCIELRVKWD